jgi:hypothetical protein
MTMTATDATPTSALSAEFARLALLAAKGDVKAEKALIALEARIADSDRAAKRQEAAEAEGQRLDAIAQEVAAQGERQAKEAKYAAFLKQRTEVFIEIESLTEKLAREVELALAVDAEAWMVALQLGWNPGRRTKSLITDHIAAALGRQGAGLTDMPMVPAGLREPLV